MTNNLIDFLIIGIGNTLRSDDGFGIEVVRKLQREIEKGILDNEKKQKNAEHKKKPENLEIIEAGSALINFLDIISSSKKVVFVDTIVSGKSPGTLLSINIDSNKRVSYQNSAYSVHSISIDEIVAISRDLTGLPTEAYVFGVEPINLDFSTHLSPTVKARVKEAVEEIIKFLKKQSIL